MKVGYHVTLVHDATAAMMHAAHEPNSPTFAHAIFTTRALLEVLPKGVDHG